MSRSLCSNVLLLVPLVLHVVVGDETALIQAKLNIKPLAEKVKDTASLAEKENKLESGVRTLTKASVNGSHKFSDASLRCFEAWLTKLESVENSACGDDCGSIAQIGDGDGNSMKQNSGGQVLAYISLAEQEHVQTVCETGFYKGFSTALWLCSNPNLHVYTFDLEIPQESLKMLTEAYPGRITAFEGDSRETLTAFAADTTNPYCDIMVADGGHWEDIPQSDFDNFALIASRDPTRQHVFVPDEVYFGYPVGTSIEDVEIDQEAWDKLEEEGAIGGTLTNTYERFLEAGAFHPPHSQCVSYAGNVFPIKGNTTLASTTPEGGWCELKFQVEYLKGVK